MKAKEYAALWLSMLGGGDIALVSAEKDAKVARCKGDA